MFNSKKIGVKKIFTPQIYSHFIGFVRQNCTSNTNRIIGKRSTLKAENETRLRTIKNVVTIICNFVKTKWFNQNFL